MSILLDEGMLFAGRYQVVRCIATGGMGAVYEVIQLETDRRRALKVMLPHALESTELSERFKREARITAHIESEYIVEVYDAGVDDVTEMPFLVMELLQGEELGAHLERVGKLPARDVVTYLHQVALALDKTHAASIVHRDLKPENLFLTHREDGAPRIKILDFGIAKLFDDGIAKAQLTRSVGTPLYMSPEQFENGQKLSGSSDIYSLGMLAYTLLVGVAYWDLEASRDSSIFALALMVAQGPKEPASIRAARMGTTLPAAFDAWFKRITAPAPEDRFPAATAAVEALATALGIPSPTVAHLPPRHLPAGAVSAVAVASPNKSLTPGPATVTTPVPPPRARRAPAPFLAAVVLALIVGAVTIRAVTGRPQAGGTTAASSPSSADGPPAATAVGLPAPEPALPGSALPGAATGELPSLALPAVAPVAAPGAVRPAPSAAPAAPPVASALPAVARPGPAAARPAPAASATAPAPGPSAGAALPAPDTAGAPATGTIPLVPSTAAPSAASSARAAPAGSSAPGTAAGPPHTGG